MQGTQRKTMFWVSFYDIIPIIEMALESSSLKECPDHEIRHEPLSRFCTVRSFIFIKLTQPQTETPMNIVSAELGPTYPAALSSCTWAATTAQAQLCVGLVHGSSSWLRAEIEQETVEITCLVSVLDANFYWKWNSLALKICSKYLYLFFSIHKAFMGQDLWTFIR